MQEEIHMNFKKFALSLVAGVSFFASSLGGPLVHAQESFKLGGNFELTGAVAAYGSPMSDGVKLAVKHVNENGGVNGMQVEYVEFDNKSDLTEAASVATRLVEEDVVAVVGPATSGDVKAQIPVMEAAGVPNVSPAGTVDGLTLDEAGNVLEYFFRVCFEDSYQGTAAALFSVNDLGAQTAAVVTDQASDYSLGLSDAFTETFTGQGGEVVVTESIQAGETDFTAVLTTLLVQDFDVLYLPTYYTEAGLFIKQARELGLTQPVLGGDGFHSPTLTELAGAANASDVYFTSHFYEGSEYPEVQEFIAAFEEEYGHAPDTFAALAYDAANLVFQAIEDAGSTDHDAVTQAIAATTDFSGVTGTFAIDEEHNPVKPALMLELQEGQIVTAEYVEAE